MSYEGYDQLLCKNGHYTEIDAMEVLYGEGYGVCSTCNQEFVWINCVDCTNSDGEEYRIELKVDKEAVTETCDKCHAVKVIEPVRWIIPKDEGRSFSPNS